MVLLHGLLLLIIVATMVLLLKPKLVWLLL
jgi:hypothetical protein